jgi:outer membrane receptor protein involved in Fe transport
LRDWKRDRYAVTKPKIQEESAALEPKRCGTRPDSPNCQFQDAVNVSVGRHSFKFGADVDYLQVDDGVPFNSRGTITFFNSKADSATGTPAFTDLGNFIDNFTGPTGTAAINFGNPEVQPFVGVCAPYVQDTWRVSSNFTVNLGLRYEYWGTVGNIPPFPTLNTQQFGRDLNDKTARRQEQLCAAYWPGLHIRRGTPSSHFQRFGSRIWVMGSFTTASSQTFLITVQARCQT